MFLGNDLEEQFEHLKQLLTALDNPIVFCHNDLLVYNILYDDKKENIHFIDYEYASPNYQLFEIANHFCEYAGVEEPDYSLCPSEAEKKEFIQKYLTFYQKRMPTAEELNRTLAMVPFFEAASHFFWSIWALIQAENSSIDFDYLKYAVVRHSMFAKIITLIGENKTI
uniref:ethanolamine kinase n=1 Tax=Panagrolaimus superbus TaxID=310955 RepID=A0A914YJS6_9BILA